MTGAAASANEGLRQPGVGLARTIGLQPSACLVRVGLQTDRSGFRSGNIDLDRFFQRYAGQNQFRHHIGTTYVAVQGDQIVGFTTVSSGELTAEMVVKALRRRLPAYPPPILRLSRLAVDERLQGHGLGQLLLRAMLDLALEMRDRVGCSGVAVGAKPKAVDFFARLGVRPLHRISGSLGDRPEPITMFLPMREIAAAAGRAEKGI